jgi:hypothetical protein
MRLREPVSKQVRATHHYVACDVCGRTMLKGEHPEPYLAPSRERKLVCQLCASRAQQEGWIRESANPATPVQPPRSPDGKRRFRRGRGRTRAPIGEMDSHGAGSVVEPVVEEGAGDGSERDGASGRGRGSIARIRRDPRHVRAVPTNAQLKIERAIALFNGSEHARTVSGIARSLGSPRVCATTSGGSAAEVVLVVAWELSWYRFVVDLSDTNEPVRVDARGQELDELEPEVKEWNASAASDGSLALDEPDTSNGEQEGDGL